MSDTNNRPSKGAPLRGDDKAMPNRGVKTGVTDSYGGGLDKGYQDKTGISGDTKSDGKIECGLGKNKR